MGKVVVIGTRYLCGRVVDFIYLIEKRRRWEVAIDNVRIGGCR